MIKITVSLIPIRAAYRWFNELDITDLQGYLFDRSFGQKCGAVHTCCNCCRINPDQDSSGNRDINALCRAMYLSRSVGCQSAKRIAPVVVILSVVSVLWVDGASLIYLALLRNFPPDARTIYHRTTAGVFASLRIGSWVKNDQLFE